MPTHIDRPPAEKFDELVIKVFKGMKKPLLSKSSKQKKKSSSTVTGSSPTNHNVNNHMKKKQKELELKNMKEQLESDE